MRYLIPLAVASGVVFALFLLMETLVTGMRWKPENVIDTIPIEFVRLKREETVQERERKKPERPPEPEAPPPPRAQIDDMIAPPGAEINVALPKVDTGVRGNFLTGAFFDAQTTAVIPLARVEPQYPRQALIDGVEGWVEVEFTITEFGTVENAHVIDSQPRGLFESSALRAIVRWKFKPKIENGVAVPFPRARYRLDFVLAKEEAP